MQTGRRKANTSHDEQSEVQQAKGIQARPGDFIKLNYEYGRVICVGAECMKAIPLSMLGGATATFIDSIGKEAWVRRREGTPADGLEPQEGIRILNGYRCRHCDVFRARSAMSVEDHWDSEGHGVAEGSMVEQVRMQSWSSEEWRAVFWVVEEGLGSEGEDGLFCRVPNSVGEESEWIRGIGGPDGIIEEWVVI
ncbi:hypothetical protein V498_04018 [Pseudogymnoascus sp. VKM F-4517 (FW-2822)]|nr:hypothetical protein V498_04018 [Pseudogymnoascus sp. VKM F-4517 (FW-2822)]